MEALKIEILNSKALQLVTGMQDVKLIKISEEPASKLKSYLKKTSSKAAISTSLDEIPKMVEEVRANRYAN